MLLQPLQEGFGLCEGEPHLLELLARLLQDHYIRDCLFMAVVFAYHKLQGHLHGGSPPAGVRSKDAGILAEM
jgi:hypothetical protein